LTHYSGRQYDGFDNSPKMACREGTSGGAKDRAELFRESIGCREEAEPQPESARGFSLILLPAKSPGTQHKSSLPKAKVMV